MNTASVDVSDLLADPLAPASRAEQPIGFVGLDIPEDILAAPPLFAVHLPWQRGRSTPWADRWLEDSFPGWARSMVEDWAGGRFDFLQRVVFTRGDDTSQRLYYYICELQHRRLVQGPEPLIFDIARIRRPSSEAWTIAAVRRLAAELDLDAADLAEGVRTANRRRELMASLDLDRRSPGHFYEQIARASLFAPIESLDLPSLPPNAAFQGRVLLAGSSPPDDHLHLAVESAGWSVVGEAYDRNLSRLGPPVDDLDDDPARVIGRLAFGNSTGPRSFHDRTAHILAEIGRRGVDVVIFWLYEEDEAIAWDVVQSQRALTASGVPTLVMTRRKWDLSDAPEADVIRFLRSLAA